MVPLAFATALPCDGAPIVAIASASPSASLSLPSTLIVAAVSSAVVTASSTALGFELDPMNGAPATHVKLLPTIVPLAGGGVLSPTAVPLPSFKPHRARRPGVSTGI